ncbi:MAG: HAMP domain-containing sensor histidine kinase [Alsobacter sp.]
MTVGLHQGKEPVPRDDAARQAGSASAPRAGRLRVGLSLRLLALTVLFVMLAEVLIYVPSIANFRRNWLQDRIGAAQIAALVLDAAPAGTVPPELERKLVMQVGAQTVAIRSGGARRLLAVTDMPPEVDHDVDLRSATAPMLIAEAFETLLAGGKRYLRVVGPGMDNVEFVEIVLDEAPLREAMLRYSINILLLSLFISGITAILVYAALHFLIVRPVRRLTSSIIAFEREPEEAALAVNPSGRTDEIGHAEEALGAMQHTLADELRQKKHLAALGLAVSKINHDLRNMLATAQLFSDRLSGTQDPTAQRFAPKLIAALDRAIGFCQSTLAYGRAAERAPAKQAVRLRALVDDLREALGLGEDDGVRLQNDVPDDFLVEADEEHLWRVLQNLGRNAVQALRDRNGGGGTLTVSARRDARRVVIDVADDGPGVPEHARARLFQPFLSSTSLGGTGLGLAIADELVRAHGGSIVLAPSAIGALFRVTLPSDGKA